MGGRGSKSGIASTPSTTSKTKENGMPGTPGNDILSKGDRKTIEKVANASRKDDTREHGAYLRKDGKESKLTKSGEDTHINLHTENSKTNNGTIHSHPSNGGGGFSKGDISSILKQGQSKGVVVSSRGMGKNRYVLVAKPTAKLKSEMKFAAKKAAQLDKKMMDGKLSLAQLQSKMGKIKTNFSVARQYEAAQKKYFKKEVVKELKKQGVSAKIKNNEVVGTGKHVFIPEKAYERASAKASIKASTKALRENGFEVYGYTI